MKYGLNKMNTRYVHNKQGGLVVKELNSILGVQGSNFTNDIHYVQHSDIDQMFQTYSNSLGWVVIKANVSK
jgi:hypothetical protein